MSRGSARCRLYDKNQGQTKTKRIYIAPHERDFYSFFASPTLSAFVPSTPSSSCELTASAESCSIDAFVTSVVLGSGTSVTGACACAVACCCAAASSSLSRGSSSRTGSWLPSEPASVDLRAYQTKLMEVRDPICSHKRPWRRTYTSP